MVYESQSFTDRPNSLADEVLTAEIEARSQQFDAKFEEKFQLEKKEFPKGQIEFAQAAMSNMLGRSTLDYCSMTL